MADQNITELPIKTNTGVANTDYMLGIDASEGYQILVRDVAKYIVENYNGSTLAGSAQTPKDALDALNSKKPIISAASITSDDYIRTLDPGTYMLNTASEYIPERYGSLTVARTSGQYGYVFFVSTTGREYIRHFSSTGWHKPWIEIGKQSDINILSSRSWTRFAITSTLASQIDALDEGHYSGYLNSNNKQETCGVPVNADCYVEADVLASTGYRIIKVCAINDTSKYYVKAKIDGTWGDWILYPTRAEIDALNSKYSDTSGSHNGIYRGKDITSYLTNGTLWKRITGTDGYKLFEDLYIGDYITSGNNSYAIVDFDYYIKTGQTNITAHHLVMMPTASMNIPEGTTLYGTSDTLTLINTANAGVTVTMQETATSFKWNATMEAPNTDNTNGGYKYSRMRNVIMKAANTIVINAFGAAHVKPISVLYPNIANAQASGLASSLAWLDNDDQTTTECKSICDLPNETQVYGQQVWGRGSAYTNVGYEIGIDKYPFAICALNRDFINQRSNMWLRSVNTSISVANVNGYGSAYASGSSTAYGVRPRFVLVG